MTISEYNSLKSRMFNDLEDSMREALIWNKGKAWASMTCPDGSWIDLYTEMPDKVEIKIYHMRENEDNAIRGDDIANPCICDDIRDTMPTWADVDHELREDAEY